MTHPQRLPRKAKSAALFLVVLLVVLGSSVWEKRLMHAMNTSAASLYQDRLLPATGLFQLNDLMYTKQQLLASYLTRPSAARQHYVQVQLGGRNVEVDSILNRYEATYLVAEETRVFGTLKARLRSYNALERELLTAAGPADPTQTRRLEQQFTRIHNDLTCLNQIQQRVGEELSKSSQNMEVDAGLVSNLKIVVLVVVTLLILQALLLDRHPLLPKSTKNFRLN
ncbi:MCP four helix bundle domain-containing protein [Hymenobacter sp. 15J16-1T3B]|uniref:MCP four helix bundle domain-containing protein n=1 Tax=Hymenobacter sp. 15J16-1T3B TaxID=2886941 RepID=UPI001D10F4D2|nr:MCP four helix bundle domain-containing protein [Hymenobacter sp. 15J16-1T3B]MCC3157930.1 MCP four helix bundle domain-containing protein [Hymenobacter sp. 15J16-1T3B]